MSQQFELAVLIWVMPDEFETLHEYERKAQPIMQRHGGSFVTVIEPTVLLGWDEPQPHEAHVLRFPSKDAFEAYRNDPELEELQHLRDRAVRRAVLIGGRTLDYLAGAVGDSPTD